MSRCCRAGPCEEVFGHDAGEWDLRDFRRHGLPRLERRMLDAIPAAMRTDGARVLDLGGGIGAMQAELLGRGAGTGEVVELVAAYAPFARTLAEDLGLAGRTTFQVLDLLDHPGEVAPADVVILNRVVCCSPDGLELTAAAADLTRGSLLISFPRDNLLTRSFVWAQHAWSRLLGRGYRVFVWTPADIIAAAASQGLTLATRERDRVWEFVVLNRATSWDVAGITPFAPPPR